jgi:hypothetical protein
MHTFFYLAFSLRLIGYRNITEEFRATGHSTVLFILVRWWSVSGLQQCCGTVTFYYGRIRILLSRQWLTRCQVFFQNFSAEYFLKVPLHQFHR